MMLMFACQKGSQGSGPSEEFELTTNSLGAHTETHGGLFLRILGSLTVNSQEELTL